MSNRKGESGSGGSCCNVTEEGGRRWLEDIRQEKNIRIKYVLG